MLKVSLTAIAALYLTIPSSTQALELISNGTFDTDLTGWTTFTTTNGTIGGAGFPQIVSFDTSNASTPSNSAQFRVGSVTFNSGVQAGGGIFQTINTTGGDLTFFANIAALAVTTNNLDGGTLSLFFDGNLLNTVGFGFITASTPEFGTLSGSITNVAAGSHEVRFLVTRTFNAIATPTQYIDNVSVIESSVPVPFEFSPALGIGVLGGVFAAKKLSKKLLKK